MMYIVYYPVARWRFWSAVLELWVGVLNWSVIAYNMAISSRILYLAHCCVCNLPPPIEKQTYFKYICCRFSSSS